MAKVARFNPGMDLHLFYSLIEDSYIATVTAHPDLGADKFSGNFIKGASHFDIAVAMNVAPSFLGTGKKRVGKRLQMGASSSQRWRPVYVLSHEYVFQPFSHLTFPLLEKEISSFLHFFAQ
jgi:hypothetical protein